MEIVKMLVLSTAHVSKSTAITMTLQGSMDELDYSVQNEIGNGLDVILYNKGENGWLVPIITDDLKEGESFYHEVKAPEDLATVLRFAMEQGCSWVMFDKDGEQIESLPKFEW